VESGEVEILRRLADGGAQLLDTVRPGRYFGELAPVLKLRRSATARARTDTVVVALTAQEFRRGAAEGAVTRATPSSGVPGARRDGSDLAGAPRKQ
jgi:CRP-like cAMP-binding protein